METLQFVDANLGINMRANTETLKAPFVYFGGKSSVADVVWQRFGDVANYVEPFFGSGAVLLKRPHEPGIETVNDKDSMISNFWRAVRSDPESVAYHADFPAIESDLHARHAWLVGQKASLTDQIEGDPEYYDAKIAGWWCWGMPLWIGSGFCSGNGPWQQIGGRLVNAPSNGTGVSKQLIHLGNAGQGIHKKRIHLGNAGRGVHQRHVGISQWMVALSDRMSRVRVCCGDWSRVMGPSVTISNGLTGIFLDPPYGEKAGRESNLYAEDSLSIGQECLDWCLHNGSHKPLRIALCGYVGEYETLLNRGWTPYYWHTNGGFGNGGNGKGKENSKKEVIWFSPHCLQNDQMSLF